MIEKVYNYHRTTLFLTCCVEALETGEAGTRVDDSKSCFRYKVRDKSERGDLRVNTGTIFNTPAQVTG